MGRRKDVVVRRLFEIIKPTAVPRVPMAVALSSYSGLSVETVKEIAIELNKCRRINSLPNYRMVSILLRVLPDEDIRYILKLNREARYGNDLNVVPCEPILDELEEYFNNSEMMILRMVVRSYNPKSEDAINTISLLSAEHRQIIRENRKKERDRLLYEYEKKCRS